MVGKKEGDKLSSKKMGENKNAFSDRILKIKLCGFETQ
jgi:hypothetical protein